MHGLRARIRTDTFQGKQEERKKENRRAVPPWLAFSFFLLSSVSHVVGPILLKRSLSVDSPAVLIRA
jgi:hypothetical protein